MKFAWSYSALNAFETCPKKYWHTRVAKDFKEEEGEALVYGKEVHKALELRVARNKALPLHLRHLEDICKKIDAAPGEKSTEVKLAVNRNFEVTGFFAADVYCRGVLDLVIINEDKAVTIDWKTGSRVSNDFSQLKIASGLLFAAAPDITSIEMAFVYTGQGAVIRSGITRKDIADLWSETLPRVERMEHSLRKSDAPPRPNGLCRKYCPVDICAYHGG